MDKVSFQSVYIAILNKTTACTTYESRLKRFSIIVFIFCASLVNLTINSPTFISVKNFRSRLCIFTYISFITSLYIPVDIRPEKIVDKYIKKPPITASPIIEHAAYNISFSLPPEIPLSNSLFTSARGAAAVTPARIVIRKLTPMRTPYLFIYLFNCKYNFFNSFIYKALSKIN